MAEKRMITIEAPAPVSAEVNAASNVYLPRDIRMFSGIEKNTRVQIFCDGPGEIRIVKEQ